MRTFLSLLKFCAVLLALAAAASAEGTQTWRQSSYEEFEKGTSSGVAISSDGSLQLAPALKAIYTSPSTYLWTLAADGSGAVYAAAGSPARVYRVTPDGQGTVVFQPEELQVQALVVDRSGLLYAATSPDGKIYRIEQKKADAAKKEGKKGEPEAPAYAVSVFFEPKTKYIWDLALDGEGRLYVATGDRGEIYRVERNGTGTVFFKSDEPHIRTLAFDLKGNLIAGSDGSGLVYRISPAGEAFVLYSAPKKEITALAVDAQGDIYAAGVGDKRGGPAGPAFLPAPQPPPQPGQSGQQPGHQPQPAPVPAPVPAFTVATGGSEVYRISPEGAPRRLWSSREDIVYALGFDEKGHLLAGTGNKGRVVLIRGEGEFTNLLKASATQVTGFGAGPNGGLFLSTSNLGKIFTLGVEPDREGSYESDVFDARVFSRWGRAEVRGEGNFEFYARSGNVDNPDRNWSPWKKVDVAGGAEVGVPAARFAQWKVVLRPGQRPPRVESVVLNYRPNNVPPVVDDVQVQVGPRAPAPPRPQEGGGNPSQVPGPGGAPRDRDSINLRWTARDDNDDDLLYSIYYRGDGEARWRLLKDKLRDKNYSLEAGLLPDGGYQVKVVASDAPSHSPDEALSSEKESARFEVDNTPPRIDDLNARIEAGQVHVTFRATDTFSPIKRAEYSLDAGEWQFVEPVGLLSDSKTENYDFSVRLPAAPAPAAARGSKENPAEAAEHVVVVRVYDRYDNAGAAKKLVVAK